MGEKRLVVVGRRHGRSSHTTIDKEFWLTQQPYDGMRVDRNGDEPELVDEEWDDDPTR